MSSHLQQCLALCDESSVSGTAKRLCEGASKMFLAVPVGFKPPQGVHAGVAVVLM
jgi:hypothetical protein